MSRKSEVAIQANRKIMKAFVAYRHLAELPLAATYLDLRKQIENLRNEVNDILSDQNVVSNLRSQLKKCMGVWADRIKREILIIIFYNNIIYILYYYKLSEASYIGG